VDGREDWSVMIDKILLTITITTMIVAAALLITMLVTGQKL
jgi:hypothetical protein